ncbi:hypothetical protein KIW84_075228 [Lathyrus oleraceus]|uniref:Uncharacterized protein n=1 Tax=Pisum sativum TaxID=3888 RepID=A0A9D4VVX0_PEA|nr:hypothetical protein KIW84_075228 [Pisum sativum]
MINLVDLVLDVAHLSIIHPPPQKKHTPSVSKSVKTSGKSSEPIIPSKDKTVVEEESRSKGSEMRKPTMHADDTKNPTEAERSSIDKELREFVTSVLKEVNSYVFPDIQTSLAKEFSLDNDSSEKAEESVPEHDALERRSKKNEDECVPEHAAHERRSKKKVDHVVNVDELTSDEEPLTNFVTPSIAKRLQRRKGKAVMFEYFLFREMKRKYGGLKDTPSRSSIRKSPIGPTRSWSKVVTPTRKRKVVSSSDSEFDVEKSSIATKIKLETLMKAMTEEEKKEVVQGGDDNKGTDVKDYDGGDDAETSEENEANEEEYATANSDSQKDIWLQFCFVLYLVMICGL